MNKQTAFYTLSLGALLFIPLRAMDSPDSALREDSDSDSTPSQQELYRYTRAPTVPIKQPQEKITEALEEIVKHLAGLKNAVERLPTHSRMLDQLAQHAEKIAERTGRKSSSYDHGLREKERLEVRRREADFGYDIWKRIHPVRAFLRSIFCCLELPISARY